MKILAYHGTGLLSWWIRTRTWSQISHVSQLLDDGTEIEAWSGGVQRNKQWGILHKKGTVVDVYDYITPLTPEETKKITDFLLAQVGKKYDYIGLFRFLPIVRWVTKQSKDILAWFCSELCMESNDVGGRRLLNKDPDQTTPEDVTTSTIIYKTDTWVCGEAEVVAKIDMSRFPVALA